MLASGKDTSLHSKILKNNSWNQNNVTRRKVSIQTRIIVTENYNVIITWALCWRRSIISVPNCNWIKIFRKDNTILLRCFSLSRHALISEIISLSTENVTKLSPDSLPRFILKKLFYLTSKQPQLESSPTIATLFKFWRVVFQQ